MTTWGRKKLTDERAVEFFETFVDAASVDHAIRLLKDQGSNIRAHDVWHWARTEATFTAQGEGGDVEEFNFAEVFHDLTADKIEAAYSRKADIADRLLEESWDEKDPDMWRLWMTRAKAVEIKMKQLDHEIVRGGLSVETWRAARGSDDEADVWMPPPWPKALGELVDDD